MIHITRLSGRNLLVGLLCIAVLGLTSCMQVSTDTKKSKPRSLVYPEPPDEPRFAYERTIMGSADAVPEDDASAMKRLLTGVLRSSEPMRKPYAVAAGNGRVLVSDTVDRSVKVFDVAAGKYFKIGWQEGPGHLVKPMGLDVDRTGKIYVMDATQKMVFVYDRDGEFLYNIGKKKDKDTPDLFDRVAGVSVDRAGERLYVTEIGGVNSENHRIRVFNAKTGEHLGDFGKRGSGDGEFNLPRDVAIGKDGQLFVVDGGNFRIQVLDKDGKFVRRFGSLGKQIGQFARPKEAATDAAGNLYVIDTAYSNVQIFNPEGELLMFIGEHTNASGPGLFQLPSGVAVDEDGRIYVVDQFLRKVDVFRPSELSADEGSLVYRGGKNAPVTSAERAYEEQQKAIKQQDAAEKKDVKGSEVQEDAAGQEE